MSRSRPSLPYDRAPWGLPHPQSTKSFWHSEPSPLLTAHRTTRELPEKADIVIIGSGITGSSVAWHLLTGDGMKKVMKEDGKGLDVVMLEARDACWGATGRNGGHCQPLLFEHPNDPSIANFELANFSALQSMIKSRDIDCDFVEQHGVRAIYDSRHLTDVELALHRMQQTSPELAKRMRLVTEKAELEDLRIPTAVGAVVTDIAARMWPYKFVSHILESLLTSQDLRGTFNLQSLTPATILDRTVDGSGWLVHTPRGAIMTRKVVLATNAYTSHLLPSFAPLIVPVRGQMSALKPLPSLASHENRLKTSYGFMGEGLDDYLIQRPTQRGGELMFGGGRQFGLSVGVTDDSVIDDDTAKYLRTRLVEALGLPEGKTDHVSAPSGKAPASPAATSQGIPNARQDYEIQLELLNKRIATTQYNEKAKAEGLPIEAATGVTNSAGSEHGVSQKEIRERGPEIRKKSAKDELERKKKEKREKETATFVPFPPPIDNSSPTASPEERFAWAFPPATSSSSSIPSASANPTAVNPSNATSTPKSRPAEFTASHEWTGIMGFSRDDLPWVGSFSSPEHQGLYISAGYTGHGMPNAWLCGKAVAVMLEAHKRFVADPTPQPTFISPAQLKRELEVYAAETEVGLPRSYLVSEERIQAALGMESVEKRDWAEMERAKSQREGRVASGYA